MLCDNYLMNIVYGQNVRFCHQSNSDLEWKYARTKLRMRYFSEVGSLPPPFNIMFIGRIIKFFASKSDCTHRERCCCNAGTPDTFRPNTKAYEVSDVMTYV